jgi:dTDP-4-dehydrorhamnose 3,5-epimerase
MVRFIPTELSGPMVVELEPRSDSRGMFARSFCAREFAEHGLRAEFVQCNVSYNRRRGTVRGLHYQLPPATEAKLIRCIHGAIRSVIVDVRPESPTYLRHVSIELRSQDRRALYVPEMFANGYQALADDAEVIYQVSEFYAPELERGLRYDDPVLGIEWPLPATEISPKDAAWPLLSEIRMTALP